MLFRSCQLALHLSQQLISFSVFALLYRSSPFTRPSLTAASPCNSPHVACNCNCCSCNIRSHHSLARKQDVLYTLILGPLALLIYLPFYGCDWLCEHARLHPTTVFRGQYNPETQFTWFAKDYFWSITKSARC